MPIQCACTSLKWCKWLKILELNWVSSCQELVGPLYNTYRIGVLNVRWLIKPFTTLSKGKFVMSCTLHPILSIFLPVPSFLLNYPWWIGRKLCYLPCEISWLKILFFGNLFFIEQDESIGGCIGDHLDMLNSSPRTHWFTKLMHCWHLYF